jgi:hypothetical protein
MNKYKVVEINGGIGRVLCAEPAISLLAKTEEIVVVTGWPDVFLGNPNIKKVYQLNQPNLFEDVVRDGNYIVPEPYYDSKYYNQKSHLIQSFNDILNGTDLFQKPTLYLNDFELQNAARILQPVLDGRPLIAFQPFGSGAYSSNWAISDPSYRSLSSDDAVNIVNSMPDFMFINCSHVKCDRPNVFNLDVNLVQYFHIINFCHYIITVDSLLAHVGYSLGKPGVQFLGPTFKENIGYPDHYTTIVREGYPKSYSPNRISGWTERNQEAMRFSKDEIDLCINTTKKFFEGVK